MKDAINELFDAIRLVADRLPDLNKLIVEVTAIGLLLLAVHTIFTKHP